MSDPSPVILKQVALLFFNISKFDLSRIKSDPNNALVNFNNYVQGFSENVRDILTNFKMDPIVQKLNKHNRLYLLIDKFTEIDLHPDVVDNHQMGTFYEEISLCVSTRQRTKMPVIIIPRAISKLLVTLLFEGDREDLGGGRQNQIRL